MEHPPNDEYVVTCQLGHTPDPLLGTVVFASPDVTMAWRYYNSLSPLAGTSIVLWDPEAGLMATQIGERN
ncbi:hypothetical protein [Skermanella stibiiresistens]|uniref:hypothetical protein n=1 Tax=Skermanella stibiiresistens TaxID=913326 RepID=UPI0004B27FFE|nr:hypothetical protein [Skermanella stibiiresistens]